MAKGFNRPPGAGGQGGMIQQLQRLQQQMAEAQEKLAQETVEATAGGGAVKVTMTGDQQCKSVEIDPGLRQDLPSEGMDGAHAHRFRCDAQWGHRGIDPRRKLLGRPPVEGHHGDRGRVRAAVHQPGDTRHEGGGLARTGWGHAQNRPGRSRRGGPLVRCEPAEALGNGRVGHGVHGREVATRAFDPTYLRRGRPPRQGWLARRGTRMAQEDRRHEA